MLKVLKNLKESAISVIVIVILLCVQATTDLALPTYTSKIVNMGIQQGGIENSAPEYVAKSQMDNLLKFTNDDEKILNDYEIISEDSKHYEKDVKDYPEIANQEVYKIKDISDEEQDSLNQAIAKPLLALSSLEAPEEVSKEDMNLMLSFVENEDDILNLYNLSEDGNTYKIKDISNVEKGKLNINLMNGLLVKQIVSNKETANQMKSSMLENLPEAQKKIFEKMSLAEILGNFPEEQKVEFINKIEAELPNIIDTMIAKLSDSMIEQAAIQEVKLQYQYLGANTDDIQNEYIFITGLQMLGIATITMLSAVTIMLLSSRVAARLGKTLREKIFKKVLSFSTEEFNGFSTASLITRTTNDIQQIQMLLTILFRVIVYAPIIAIGGFIRVLFNSDASMAWIIGLAVVCIIIIVLTLMIVAMPRFKSLQKLVDKLNLVSREILTGSQVIRAFNTEKREEKRFDGANQDLMKTQVFVNRAMTIMMPALMLVMNCITILIVWVGGHNVNDGLMQVGDVMAFIQYTMQIVMAFLMISMVSIMLPRAMVSAIEDAKLKPEDITYINAHGTSTHLNDAGETTAIKKALGEEASKNVLVSSTKSNTGHLLGAAGGVEAIVCVKAIEDGYVPATINYKVADPECDLDIVPNEGRNIDVKCAMSNSLGFGGHNGSIIFKKYEG